MKLAPTQDSHIQLPLEPAALFMRDALHVRCSINIAFVYIFVTASCIFC